FLVKTTYISYGSYGAYLCFSGNLTCQQVLATPTAVGNATNCCQRHRLLATPSTVGNAAGCWQCHRLLAMPPAIGNANSCRQPLPPLHDLSPIHDPLLLRHILGQDPQRFVDMPF